VGSNQAQPEGKSEQRWLDLQQIATVEVTSEDASFPIESAFAPKGGAGWRASFPGEQQIRIIFDQPVSLHRIELRFDEADSERTQEFTLRWSAASGGSAIDVVRQQWHFQPCRLNNGNRTLHGRSGRSLGFGTYNSSRLASTRCGCDSGLVAFGVMPRGRGVDSVTT
jgi:hypothetical protein